MIGFVLTAREEAPYVLRRTIDELRATTPSGSREIVVVDDGSRTPVAGCRAEVEVIRHEVPVGVSCARRAGFNRTIADVLVCLDAHMTFAPDWLDQMLAHVALCNAFRQVRPDAETSLPASLCTTGPNGGQSGSSPDDGISIE